MFPTQLQYLNWGKTFNLYLSEPNCCWNSLGGQSEEYNFIFYLFTFTVRVWEAGWVLTDVPDSFTNVQSSPACCTAEQYNSNRSSWQKDFIIEFILQDVPVLLAMAESIEKLSKISSLCKIIKYIISFRYFGKSIFTLKVFFRDLIKLSFRNNFESFGKTINWTLLFLVKGRALRENSILSWLLVSVLHNFMSSITDKR